MRPIHWIFVLAMVAAVATPGPGQDKAAPAAEPQEGQDVFYLASDRLVVLRFVVTVDGKSPSQRWREFLDEQFKTLDLDGNKKLTGAETRDIPNQQVLEALGLVKTTRRRFATDPTQSAGERLHPGGLWSAFRTTRRSTFSRQRATYPSEEGFLRGRRRGRAGSCHAGAHEGDRCRQ